MRVSTIEMKIKFIGVDETVTEICNTPDEVMLCLSRIQAMERNHVE